MAGLMVGARESRPVYADAGSSAELDRFHCMLDLCRSGVYTSVLFQGHKSTNKCIEIRHVCACVNMCVHRFACNHA